MGIAPPHGSHAALPIACDALNARTVAVRKYHCIFCAVVARKPLHLLSGAVLVARLSGREYSHQDSVMAHPPYGSAQKERIRFALCCAAVILRRFLFQGSEWLCCRVSSGTEKGVKVRASRRRCGYSSVLKVRTAIISFACSRSRMSWSTPK